MNLGYGFSIPQDKGVIQNGNIWIPATPEKPVVQRPNCIPIEMQQSQMGVGNWQDLLEFYTGVLQGKTCNGLPQKFNPNSNVGLNHEEHKLRDFAPVETYSLLPQNFNPTGIIGVNSWEHNIQDYAQIEKFRSFNQDAGSVRSNEQNLGGDVPPPKVNTLAELIGMKSSPCALQTNGMPNRSTCVMDKPTMVSPSQLEGKWRTCESTRAILQQNHILHANQGIGGHHRHQFNLNILPRSEDGEFSRTGRSCQLGPKTPDQQKQSKNYQIIQVPHVLIDEISPQTNNTQENVVLSQRPETVERNHDKYMHNTLSTSSAAISTSPQEKNNSDDGNVGVDLNKAAQQKTPKRIKHRPKVIVEGKVKRTPKPAAAKNNHPDGNPTGKRKYVRKKGIKTSTQLTDVANEVEVSNVEPSTK